MFIAPKSASKKIVKIVQKGAPGAPLLRQMHRLRATRTLLWRTTYTSYGNQFSYRLKVLN